MARSTEEKRVIEAPENERTTETGLFHFAVSYNAAADTLGEENPLHVTHPEEPREFLYAHAIELYLKSYLRDRGKTVQELRSFGHSLNELSEQYERAGGVLDEKDRWVVKMLALNNTSIEARYIKTGYYRKAAASDVQKTAASLRKYVGEALRRNGRVVRWYT